MARLAAKALVLTTMLASPAWAGDRALIDFIGYSQSGQYFAFTEMGVQDGSGFAYANVFVLDVSADSFIGGSPFRVRFENEDQSVAEAHKQALAAARPVLEQFDIFYPVDVLALSGDAETVPVDTLNFGIPRFLAPTIIEEPQSLWLESYPASSVEPCASYTDLPIKGFKLSYVNQGEWIVHRDETIPASRGCPLDYAIYAVLAPMDAEDAKFDIAIISVLSLGFEGPDRRFVAIPIGN